MRLLVTTQALDLDDPVLGFFHGWLVEFAKHCEAIEVICLREGRYQLPTNVRVSSLGKERGRPRVSRVLRFYRLVWSLRNQYDAVFVHMNQEYVLLAGILWRFLGKKVILWRNHKKGTWQTRIAAMLSTRVCYTSPSAYVAHYQNATRMPIGIDTTLFTPTDKAPADSILFLGRLDPVKKLEVFLAALASLEREHVHADVYGDATVGHESYAREVKSKFTGIPSLEFHGAVRNEETPAIYRAHAIYCNLTPSGSFDKTIGEAMASGCLPIVANDAVKDVIPTQLFVTDGSTETLVSTLRYALSLAPAEREHIARSCREYVEREHSLALLSQRLFALLS